jgi:hypothetical protein
MVGALCGCAHVPVPLVPRSEVVVICVVGFCRIKLEAPAEIGGELEAPR